MGEGGNDGEGARGGADDDVDADFPAQWDPKLGIHVT